MSAGSLSECRGFITLSVSVISPSVVKMLINLVKSPFRNVEGSGKRDSESVSWTGSPPKVNQFFRLVGPITTLVFNEIG